MTTSTFALCGGGPRHPDAPADVCGATDPRNETAWCRLAPKHPGENHDRYAPRDDCRTWTEHKRHEPSRRS